MTNTFTISRGLGAQELTRMAAAVEGTYVFPSDAGGVVTPNSGMTLDYTEIEPDMVTIDGVLDTAGKSSAQVTISTADATRPRRDIVYYDADNTVAVKVGAPTPITATTGPALPVLAADEIAIFEVYVGIGVTEITSTNIIDRRQGSATVVRRNASDYTHSQSDTTLANVPGLAFPVGADEVWTVVCELQCSANASGGLKIAFTVPSGTVTGTVAFGVATAIQNRRSSDLTTAEGQTAALVRIRVAATFRVGVTGGSVQLQAAQNASHASDSTIFADSTIEARRVG